ncbi:MAG TPA: hypothetical protein VH595_19285 [Verrucomicrobiae bacterium]|jgi:hypothetical protein|nr:hypothetical protein [Verrucomicrobiae bacterium]
MQFVAANLAYRYLAFALMVSQANWFCQTLGLPRDHILTLEDVRQGSSVDLIDTNYFGGSIETDNYFFGFDAGHICSFVKRGHGAQSDAVVKRQNNEWSRLHSMIGTNDAFVLATNWLGESGVKLSVLESNFTMTITQWKFYPQYQPTNGSGPLAKEPVLLPIFQVEWHGDFVRKGHKYHGISVAKVIIFGPTKELWQCDVFSEGLVRQPLIHVKNLDKVLSISDKTFESYHDLQLSNFVAQFGGGGAK